MELCLSGNSRTIVVLLFVFFVILSIFSLTSGVSHRYTICPNTTLYTSNSTYQANLNSLFSYLSSNATLHNNIFYNATAGRDSDKVYGLYLCRGDITQDLCGDCVMTASRDIIGRCPNGKVGITWYDECMLRYANRSIFSILEVSPVAFLWNSQDIKDPARFKQLVNKTMTGIVTRTAFDASAGKFATGVDNFSSFQRLYGLAQCTPDISGSDCSKCFGVAMSKISICCDGKQGGRVLLPSCYLRYEVYQFYQIINITQPPLPPPLPSPPSSNGTFAEKGGNSSRTIVAIVVPITIIAVVLFSSLFYCLLRRKKKGEKTEDQNTVGDDISTVESLKFGLSSVLAATNNFADDNKIGEGGFGDVYKGVLHTGQKIAVKRLSRNSSQGAEEFKNEVVLIAKLQHRNLVRVLGFCLEREEKILIYEFVPNKSLHYNLFDPEKCRLLDWPKRYKIIEGIARGILYLHEDSRLRVIHRDLKASNVLLDEEMNPKISDFGMARIFGVDQTEENTNRIVGTYGYMSPEYAMHGQFSVKSDVFSFGVLLLEIVSGKKNSSFYQPEFAEDLLSYAWRQWKQGVAFELMDPILKECSSRSEVMRCIQIGLLCVQEDIANRPTMASVVVMLSSYSVSLSLPLQPAFCVRNRMESNMPIGEYEQRASQSNQSTSNSIPLPINEMSISELDPR